MAHLHSKGSSVYSSGDIEVLGEAVNNSPAEKYRHNYEISGRELNPAYDLLSPL